MRTRFLESLRARLMLLVALALVPAIALTVFTALEQRELHTQQVEQSNLRIARLMAADQEQLAEQARQVLTALALTHGPEWRTQEGCERALATLQDELPYDNLGVFDAQGILVCSQRPVSDGALREVVQAQESGRYHVGGYDIDESRQSSSLLFALPMTHMDGSAAGSIFATARTEWFAKTAGKTTLPDGSIVFVVGSDGRIIARYPADGASIGRVLDGSPLLAHMVAVGEGVTTLRDEDGVDRIYAFTPVRGSTQPAHIAVGVPTAVALEGASAAFARDMATLTIVGGFAIGAAWVVSDVSILRPMRRLVGATLRLRSGIMSARTGIPRGRGEFGQLARWFDEMAASLEREHEELRRLSRLELYKLLAENATDLISRLTPEGSVLYASPASRRLLGYASELMPGRFLTGLAHPDDVHSTREAFSRALDSAEPVTVLHRLRRRDGDYVWAETTAQGVRDERGVATEIIAVSRDVTERMRTQAELEEARTASDAAARAKSEFLANMSHEIRTPMNAVIGMTSLLQETPLDDEQHEFVDTIRSSGDHLLTIIDDILDFSKIESQRLELERHPFSLRATIEESLDLVAGAASQKGLELACELSEETPEQLMGDAGRLRQILVNLLSNAVKFTHHGEVVVSVHPRRLDDARHELEFSVRDTGIGIPSERIGHLFQPFSQVDASTTRHYGGSGLGLAICRHLATLMGGRIWVESEPDLGSTFRFTIHVDEAPAANPAATPAASNMPEPGLAGRRVLVVDDNATNRRILALQLSRWGMRVECAQDGRDALARLRRGDVFDIALLDLRMPGMDGIQLAAHIRATPGAKETPLVLLSSIGRGRAEAREAAAGLEATLLKPVKPRQLHDVLVRVFGAAPSPEEPRPRSLFDPDMARRHPLRILLAEDNLVNQKVALRMLERLGYTAKVAGNGLEAVQAVARDRYDVVLMDVQMPGVDGLDATRRIRELQGGGPRIVALTAHASAEDRAGCLAAGMDDYLSKPLKVDQLIGALERAGPRKVTP